MIITKILTLSRNEVEDILRKYINDVPEDAQITFNLSAEAHVDTISVSWDEARLTPPTK